MYIRQASLKDSKAISAYLLLAMEEIVYKFIGEIDHEKAKQFLHHFIELENNQYSYQNCWVVEVNNQIIAAVNLYDGEELVQLRAPIIEYIKTNYNTDFNPENETQAGEYYIDTLGVDPKHQGKGIGAALLQFLINDYVDQQQKILGLLVEEDNLQARKLYLKLGFKPIGYKTLMGKPMQHLQLKRHSNT